MPDKLSKLNTGPTEMFERMLNKALQTQNMPLVSDLLRELSGKASQDFIKKTLPKKKG